MNLTVARSNRDVRRANRVAILRRLRAHAGSSRVALAQALGLSKALVTQIVADLIAEGWVRERPGSSVRAGTRAAGRPQIGLDLVGDARCGIGLLLVPTGTNHEVRVEAALAGFDGRVDHLPGVSGHPRGNRGLISLVARAFEQGLEAVPAPSALRAVTLGFPGVVVDRQIVLAPRLGYTVGSSLVDDLERRLGVPVEGENDAALGALSELHDDPGRPPFAFLLIDAGVGAAIYRDGVVLGSRRASPRVGEVGHVSIPTADGGLRELEAFLGVPGACIGTGADLAALEAGVLAGRPEAMAVAARYATPLVTILQMFSAWGCAQVVLQFPSDTLRDAILRAAQAKMSGSRLTISVGRPAFGPRCLVTGAALDAVGDAGDAA